jgi:hypothetical protein
MEEVLDSLRRIIGHWTRTITPLAVDAHIGDDILTVRNTIRFAVGDEIIVRGPTKYEKPPQFTISDIIDDTHFQVSSPIALKTWTVAEGSIVQKLIHGNKVEGIYIGDPENIPEFPAITINGISEETPEWLTLDSVKDVFNVEIMILVEDSTQEEGYRFLLRMAKLVKFALMNNLFPLVNDYATTAITADVQTGDTYIKVADSSVFACGNVILLEDMFKSREARVAQVIDSTTLLLNGAMPATFMVSDGAIVIQVRRFIFNSYPKAINYGKIHKGTLLKAAVLDWYGWEEVFPPGYGDGWVDPQLH